MEENTDKFINTVQSFTPLWDMKDKRYHSRDIQRKLWAKVAQEVGGKVAELKKKWKGLRDAFRREFKKLLESGQEAPEQFESSWPFFEQMLFLRDVMEPRQLKGNISPPKTEIISEDDNEDNNELEGETKDLFLGTSNSNTVTQSESQPHLLTPVKKMGPPATTPTKGKFKRLEFNKNNSGQELSEKVSSIKKKRLSSVDTSEAQFLEMEKSKLKLLESNASMKSDTEYKFLICLLPYLKKFPALRQLQVGNKLQQVIIDEQERNSLAPINYNEPCPTMNQSPGHSSWSNGVGTGTSSDDSFESSWEVPPVNSRLQSFVNNFQLS